MAVYVFVTPGELVSVRLLRNSCLTSTEGLTKISYSGTFLHSLFRPYLRAQFCHFWCTSPVFHMTSAFFSLHIFSVFHVPPYGLSVLHTIIDVIVQNVTMICGWLLVWWNLFCEHHDDQVWHVNDDFQISDLCSCKRRTSK